MKYKEETPWYVRGVDFVAALIVIAVVVYVSIFVVAELLVTWIQL